MFVDHHEGQQQQVCENVVSSNTQRFSYRLLFRNMVDRSVTLLYLWFYVALIPVYY